MYLCVYLNNVRMSVYQPAVESSLIFRQMSTEQLRSTIFDHDDYGALEHPD